MSSSSVSGSGLPSRFEAFKENVSQKLEVAFPAIHALFGTNYEAATVQNRDLKVSRYTPIGFNQMIDRAISMIGQAGETKETIATYLERRTDFRDFDNDEISIPFSRHLITPLADKIKATKSDSELKTELLKFKQASEGSEFSAKVVTKLINLSTSLANTAAESKKVECTDLRAQRVGLGLERVEKVITAGDEYHQSHNQLAVLEELLRGLAGINDGTTPDEIDAFFDKFLELKPSIMRLIGTGNEQARAVTSLLDQIDGSPASKIAFFKDLQKTESDYFKILMRSVVKARQEVIEKAALLNLANREVRTEGFNKFDLRYDPRTGIIFKDVFNKCNNLEAPTKLLSKLVQRLNTSLIDPSKGSVIATGLNVALVGLYVIFKMAQAVVSLGFASMCYIVGSAAWGIGKSGRYIFGQGFDRLKDHFKKTHIPKNNNLELQAEIALSDRPANLLAGLRLTDFYKAYEATLKLQRVVRGHKGRKQVQAQAKAKDAAVKIATFRKRYNVRKQAAEAEAARILEDGKEAAKLIATYQRALEALARAQALKVAQQNGSSLTQSLRDSGRAGKVARENVRPMFQSLGFSRYEEE